MGLLRRFAVMLGGEAVQSTFHLGIHLVLARTLAAVDYGVFAIIFLIGGISLTVMRALAGVPASILIPQARGRDAARAIEVTFGSGATLLASASGTLVGCALLARGSPGWLAGGAFVALWSLRSYVRLALFSRMQAGIVTASDVAFTLSGTGLAFWLMRGDGVDVSHAFVALAAANGLAILVALVLRREPVRVSFGHHVRRRYRSLGRPLAWSALGVVVANVQAQGQTLVVALIAGPAAYAPIAAMLVVFSPLRLPTSALVNMLQPEMAGRLGRGESLLSLVGKATGALALGAALYGGVLYVLLPAIQSHLFAGRFDGEPMGLIALVIWSIVTVTLLYAAPRTAVETARAFRAISIASAVSAAVGIATSVAILVVTGPPALSLVGVLVSELVILAFSWAAILHAAPFPRRPA